MTPKLCSVHNHATLCDGRDTPEAMAAAAFTQGIRYFGLSCHSHTPIPDDEGAVLPGRHDSISGYSAPPAENLRRADGGSSGPGMGQPV